MTEVTCAIIIQENKVLITQRSETMPHPLKWEFPGGKLKPGESPEKCIKREICEELNLHIVVDQMLPTVIFDYGKYDIKLIPFICRIHSGTISLAQHKAFKWAEKNELEHFDLLEADLAVKNMLLERLK